MPILSYAQPGLVLTISAKPSQQIRDLQYDLRSLGYLIGHIDGWFKSSTARSVRALQFDLLHNAGASSNGDGSAPVAVTKYNRGRVTGITGVVDQNLVACITEMLDDSAFPKLPSSASPQIDNERAMQAISSAGDGQVPFPFLYAILMQESGGEHFHVPLATDSDTFVTVGCDTNDGKNPDHITSRGFGIGQFTLFHHPPASAEMTGYIADPVGNVMKAIADLRQKLDKYVVGPADKADDRTHEIGNEPLRLCKFDPTNPLFMRDCINCLRQAGTQPIVAGQTPLYEGSPGKYEKTQYHPGSYSGVPVRRKIPCDWPYAVRRYNGSGPNSYDYQAEVLLKVLDAPQYLSSSET
jgi:hypothetical protein